MVADGVPHRNQRKHHQATLTVLLELSSALCTPVRLNASYDLWTLN